MPDDPQLVARGAAWGLASRLAAQLLQIGGSIVLARLVAPEAFGLVAMVATVTAFAGMIVEAGFTTAIVQRPDLTDEHVNAAFAVTLACGAIISSVLLAAAPWVSRFYGPAVLAPLTRLGAVGVLIGAVSVVPRALLVRKLRLKRVALIDLSGAVVSIALSIALALAGYGVWALALPAPIVAAIVATLTLTAARWRPRTSMSATAAAALSRIALHLLAFNIVNYWARTLDNVLIGAWIGERELGLYVRAYALMLLPITEITSVLATAMLPALSRVQRDHATTRATYLKTLGLVGLVAFPAMLGLSVVAEPFVALLYGPPWAGVAPMLRILAIVGAIQAVMSPVGWLYNAQGRTELMFRWGVVATAVVTAALAYGAWLGSGVQVAVLYLVANVVLFVPPMPSRGGRSGFGSVRFVPRSSRLRSPP